MNEIKVTRIYPNIDSIIINGDKYNRVMTEPIDLPTGKVIQTWFVVLPWDKKGNLIWQKEDGPHKTIVIEESYYDLNVAAEKAVE